MFPKTFEEACSNRGYDAEKILPDVSNFPEVHQKAITSYAKLIVISECINEGWKPDWNDGDEYKYYPWFDMEVDDNNPSGFRFHAAAYASAATSAAGGSRLCFKTSDDAERVAKDFIDLWRDMMVLPK
jgi:hypothetical protein